MVGIEKLFYDVTSKTPSGPDQPKAQPVVRKGRFLVFGKTAAKVFGRICDVINFIIREDRYNIKAVTIGNKNCFVIQAKNQNRFRDVEARKVGSANMGPDGELGIISGMISKKHPYEQAKKGLIGLIGDLIQRNFSDNGIREKLETPENIRFASQLHTLKQASESGDPDALQHVLNELVMFLGDPQNTQKLLSEMKKVGPKKFEPEEAVKTLFTNIFLLNGLEVQHREYENNKRLGPDAGGIDADVSFEKYLEDEVNQLKDNRNKEIEQLDICFFQEFHDPENLPENLKDKVTILNNRGNVIVFKKDMFEQVAIKKTKTTHEGDDASGKGVDLSKKVRVNPDGSFSDIVQDKGGYISDRNFNAAIIKDKITGKKLVVCSIQVPGYAIGDKEATAKARDIIRNAAKLLEKIKSENNADDIVWGGDFNSVQEDLPGAESALKPLKKGFKAVDIQGPTEVAPPSFRISQYSLARKIDHLVHTSGIQGGKGSIPEGSPTVKDQSRSVFDHSLIKATLGLKPD